MDVFLVFKENTLTWEDKRTNSHGMTSHVQIQVGAILLGYFHSFTEEIISACGRCSGSMYGRNDSKNMWLHLYFVSALTYFVSSSIGKLWVIEIRLMSHVLT